MLELLKKKLTDVAVVDSGLLKTPWKEVEEIEKEKKKEEINEENVKTID